MKTEVETKETTAALPAAAPAEENSTPAAAEPEEKPTVKTEEAEPAKAATSPPPPAAAAATNDSSVKKEKESTKSKTKLDLSKVPVRQFLDMTVVPQLLSGLASVARERPANPLEYLGNFLLEKSKEADIQAE